MSDLVGGHEPPQWLTVAQLLASRVRVVRDAAVKQPGRNRVASINEYVAGRVFSEPQRLEAVAVRLGLRSLDVAASNRKRTTAGRLNDSRKDKVGKLPLHKHVRPSGGTCSHTLRVRGGVYQMQVLNDDGNTIWQDLEVLGYKGGRPDSDGNHRWYHVVSVPCQYEAQTVLIPLFHELRAKMKGQKLNRGEHFRFYPQNTEQHQILYGRRNDTESLHRQLKRTMDRMPAYSAQRQAIFLLGVQLAHNSMTMAFERRRAGLPNVIDGNT